MRVYIEANEIVGMDDAGEFIRADVTSMSFDEVIAVTEAVVDIMKGKTYEMITHYCGHDEGKGCEMEPVL